MQLYETEEEQVEALKKWWQKNSHSVITGVALGIGVLAGWNIWQEQKKSTLMAASDVYYQLLSETEKDSAARTQALGAQLQNEYGSTPYADFGQLFQAKQKVMASDLAGARAILENLLQNGNDESLRPIVRLRLAKVIYATGDFETALANLGSMPYPEAFAAQYSEFRGDVLVSMERFDEAREAYQNASNSSGQKSPVLQIKLNDLAQPEISEPELNEATVE